MSSSRPINGLTYLAPAFAAKRAWFGENTRVILTGIPSAVKLLQAFSPSPVIGHLTITLSPYLRSRLPSSIIPS